MLFISHKTEDKAIANEVLRRALEHGYSDKQIFLDSDPGSGIEAGTAWERTIYESLKHTRAMIVLCSPNWLKSQWCFVELGYAKAMAISVFPIVIEPCEVGSTLSATQAVDLTRGPDAADRDAAFERLWTALDAQHLGPKDNLPWPPQGEPDHCPFPGLMCFDEKHAPVFFGREPERDAVIQRLQAMRGSGVPRLLMIVGGSGSGKSSLLRAGVLPWLRHPTEQRDWLVLPTLRYGETPNDDVTLLARLAEVIAESYPSNHPQRPAWKELRNKFESDDVERAARDFVDATLDLCQARRTTIETTAPTIHSAPTLLLAIDQFEELLTAAARPSAQKFLRFLRTLLSRSNGRLLVIGTMRSDYLDTYEQRTESLKPPFLELYRLPPFPWERVTDVITKPAERVDVTFTDELITRLKGDAPNSDALPQLAFTLEKLFRQCAGGKLVELREYEQLGGITGAITQAVTRILPKDMPKEMAKAVRLSFVKHLAQVNENDEFVRRTARWSDLPHAAKSLLEQFVRERLLHRSGVNGEQIEVSHEALFRSWDQLTKWLNESRQILLWRRDIDHDRNTAPDSWQGLTRSQLAVARKWPRERPDELSPDETMWIKRGVRRERFVQALVTTVIVVISGLGCWAWYLRGEAFRQNQVAEQKTREVQQVAAISMLNNGRYAIENEGDIRKAVAWFGQAALTSEPGSPQRLAARNLIGSWSRSLPIHSLLHDGAVHQAAFSPDGVLLATASDEMVARLWNVKTGEPHGEPLPHQGKVNFVGFNHDGTLIVTASADRTSRLWDVATQKQIGESLEHLDSVLSSVFSIDGHMLATASVDRTARLWDVATGKPLSEPLKHSNWVGSVVFSADGNTLLTSGDNEVKLWDVTTGEERSATFTNIDGSSISISPDGKMLATRSGSTARLWDMETGMPRGQPLSHVKFVNSVAFSPDSSLLATASGETGSEGAARLWVVATGEPRSAPLPHRNRATSVAFSLDGKTLAVATADAYGKAGDVHLWDVAAQQCYCRPLQHNDEVNLVVFSADGRTLATASADHTARLWDVSPSQMPGDTPQHQRIVNSVALSEDGITLATASSDSTARLWDVSTGKPRGESMRHESEVRSVAFSPDGRTLATASIDRTARLWSVPTGQPISMPLKHDNWVTSVTFSPDGRKLATAGGDQFGEVGEARLWDVATGMQLGPTFQHTSRVNSVAFSANGHLFATASSDYTTKLWDVVTGQQHGVTLNHDGDVHSVEFSPDGRTLATASADHKAKLWDVATGKELGELVSHKNQVKSVAFSPDGSLLATGSMDSTAQLWDVATRKPHGPVLKHDDIVNLVAFSPNGSTLVTRNFNQTVLWDVATGQPRGAPFRHTETVTAATFGARGNVLATASADHTARLWDLTSAADQADQLWLSVEVRTWHTFDQETGLIRPLTIGEWQERRVRLDRQGGPCDVLSWKELSPVEQGAGR